MDKTEFNSLSVSTFSEVRIHNYIHKVMNFIYILSHHPALQYAFCYEPLITPRGGFHLAFCYELSQHPRSIQQSIQPSYPTTPAWLYNFDVVIQLVLWLYNFDVNIVV